MSLLACGQTDSSIHTGQAKVVEGRVPEKIPTQISDVQVLDSSNQLISYEFVTWSVREGSFELLLQPDTAKRASLLIIDYKNKNIDLEQTSLQCDFSSTNLWSGIYYEVTCENNMISSIFFTIQM
ncbi:MAG: hypothetical protein KDD46_08055 [Bdellovibrionales bacterium]|nr:hypothetical protein [Bdellovibrionales bacterium]